MSAPATQLSLSLPSASERRFWDFCERNPHILGALEDLALELYAAGAKRIGVKAMWEKLRMDAAVRTDSRDWKLNNTYTAPMARMLIAFHPELASVIETRSRRDGS